MGVYRKLDVGGQCGFSLCVYRNLDVSWQCGFWLLPMRVYRKLDVGGQCGFGFVSFIIVLMLVGHSFGSYTRLDGHGGL